MHGRKRAALDAVPPEKLRQQRQQVQAALLLLQQLLKRREEKVYTPQLLETTEKILSLSPELATVWGYRREAVLYFLENCVDASLQTQAPVDSCNANGQRQCEEACLRLLRTELKLTTLALKEGDTKIYCLWHHRGWVVAQLIDFYVLKGRRSQLLPGERGEAGCSDRDAALGERNSAECGIAAACKLVEEELRCCEALLEKVDGRNFHCWQHWAMHRIWLSALKRMQTTDTGQTGRPSLREEYGGDELLLTKDSSQWIMQLTERLIAADFSNYSAWHIRGLALKKSDLPKELAWLWQVRLRPR